MNNSEIAQAVKADQGGSYYLLDGKLVPVEPRDGDVYAVGGALDKFGESIPALFVPLSEFDGEAVQLGADYVAKHRRGTHDEWAGVGFWIDEAGAPDIVCIDAIDIIEGRALATATAIERGEQAIFALNAGEVISL